MPGTACTYINRRSKIVIRGEQANIVSTNLLEIGFDSFFKIVDKVRLCNMYISNQFFMYTPTAIQIHNARCSIVM
jgi:hypothetical protein